MAKLISILSGIVAIGMACVGFLTSSTWYTGIFFFFVYAFTWPIIMGYWLAVLYLVPFLRANGLA